MQAEITRRRIILLSLYQCSIPTFITALNNLAGILTKGASHVKNGDLDESVLINFRLYPDMLPLSFQVQAATDFVRRGAARIAAIDAPSYEDNEASFAELQSRVEKTMIFLASVPEESIEKHKHDDIVFQAGPYDFKFGGLDYVNSWVKPNLYFHITSTYNILRHNGVELGKLDFLGALAEE